MALLTPRRCGAPSHIRVQLWDLQDDLAQTSIGLDEGLLDPRDLPNKNDHHVFGLCGYQGDEPRFYYYKGILEDCPAHERTDTGYLYRHESEMQQAIKAIGGTWNVSSVHEWRSLITSHVPGRVLDQQVKFHLAGGGDKSAQLHQIEVIGDERFDQAFFRTVIAPELIAPNSDNEGDTANSFEDLLYTHFSTMASATIKTEQEQQVIQEQEEAVRELGSLVAAGKKAGESHDSYQKLLTGIARDVGAVRHLVQTDPFPGLLDARKLPSGRVGEIAPYIVIDKMNGAMILDVGLEKLTNVVPRVLNQSADRSRIHRQEVDESQVIDYACDLVIYQSGNRGGGYTRKAYTLDAALQLIPLLREIGTAKLAGAPEVLQQAFAWVESTADTNGYRKASRLVEAEIRRHQEDIKRRIREIAEWEAKVKDLGDRITKYDQAKGAYEDLAKSGKFTQTELESPLSLTSKVARELRAAEEALSTHDRRVGSLEKIFVRYMTFCQDNPEVSARARLEDMTARMESTKKDLLDAEQRLQQSRDDLVGLNGLHAVQENRNGTDKHQLDAMLALQSHQPIYTEWFGDTQPDTIDIRGGLKKISDDEKDLGLRRQDSEKLRDAIKGSLPSVPRFRELFGDTNAESIDISSELQNVATQEKVIEKEWATADALQTRILGLKPFVESFRSIFGDADPAQIDPSKERADLQQAIALSDAATTALQSQVSRLSLFRATYPDWAAAEWLADMESRRSVLAQEVTQCNQQITTTKRQLAELMTDPVARPEDMASAHALIDGAVPFIQLHGFIEKHCPPGVKQHWLTHFSALLFAPVVETIEEATKAARLLHGGQATLPVLIASRLKAMMENDTPTLALDGECAYTWIAGIKTRMVHCLLNPAAVEEERSLAQQRLDELQETLRQKKVELGDFSERSELVLLARDAERAEISNAEAALEASSRQLEQLQAGLPKLEARCTADALESLQKTKEYLDLLRERGKDIQDRIAEELRQINERAEVLRKSRAWYEECNTDMVRKVIMDMRSYQSVLEKHGTNVQQTVEEDLSRIGEEAEDLRRSREWHENRDRDEIRAAIAAMLKYGQAGGAAEADRLKAAVSVGLQDLETLSKKIADTNKSIIENEGGLSVARTADSNAAGEYNRNKEHLEELASFAESDNLPFMETHVACRATLEACKGHAEARKGYDSQFAHAQRYLDETKGSESSEKDMLNRKAELETCIENAKLAQVHDARSVEDKNGRLVSLKNHQAVLHESACRLLIEYRAISKSMGDIQAGVSVEVQRFENTDLYLHAESIRTQIEAVEVDPFLMESIRKLGRLALDLGLDGQSKDITRGKKDADNLSSQFRTHKVNFCSDIIAGKRKGLSVLNAEWLQEQDEFDGPKKMKDQIESSIQHNRALLQQATTSLEFARDKTTEMLTVLAEDAKRALEILGDTMNTTPTSRFFVSADVVSKEKIGDLLISLYKGIESQMRQQSAPGSISIERRQKLRFLEKLREDVYQSLFADVSVEFKHPSIWEGGQHKLPAKGLSEGMKTAVGLMWIAKLAEFRLRQAIDQAGGMKRQNRAALRKERYFVILDGLFSNLSHDDMIDAAMESLRLSSGHFQLIGMIHHPRYINNPKIFPSYFVGRPYRASNGKHAWLTVDLQKDAPGSLGVFGSHFTP